MSQELDLKPIESKSADLVKIGSELVIDSPEAEATGANIWNLCNSLLKEIDETLGPPRDQAHKLWKSLVALQASTKEPLEKVMAIIKSRTRDYRAKEEAERIRKEKELQEAARKLEEDRRLEEAAEMERNGNSQAADELLQAPIEPVPVIVQAAPKPKGAIPLRDNWTFRITDETLIPREFLVPDTKKIGQYAKAMKASGKIPGVEIYVEKV